MMKKYELTGETKYYFGMTLFRIKALRSFNGIEKGELGGWVEKESNLSHDGDCWILGNVQIWGNAQISGNAHISGNVKISGGVQISGNAQIWGDVQIWSDGRISGDTEIWGNPRISGNAEIWGNARISGDTLVLDNVQICGDTRISGDAWISGNAQILGNAVIATTKDYVTLGPLGDNTFITLTKSNKMINAGCFHGSFKEFKDKVDSKYPDKDSDYRLMMPSIKKWLNQKLVRYFKD